jgi:hypothetical protein
MSTADEQRRRMQEFHALPERTRGLSLAEWRDIERPWKARMGVEVQVGALRALLDDYERLLRLQCPD